MGRAKKIQNLHVFLNDKQIGVLTKETNGAIEFRYTEEWISSGFGISLSLPVADRVFTSDKASFYFDNLLPDNKKVLEAIAEKFGAESTKQFDLLYSVGKDCVGALSFFDENETPDFIKKLKIKPLSDEVIARRIQHLATDNPLGMEDGDFRLSLAGAQEKMALLSWKGKWYEPKGQTPTSHIIKKKMGNLLGGIDFGQSVENEWLCLKIAKKFGINCCEADITSFEQEKVLVVKRFDRVWKEDFLYRVPQEDLCQAMGISPHNKYERNSGPSIKKIMALLDKSNNASEDRKTFFSLAVLNDLLHNTDGHAKNVSIFVTRAGFALTPMYDLLSAHFLKEKHPDRYEILRSSLSVNGKFIFKDITLDDWKAEALGCGFNPEKVFEGYRKIIKELSANDPELCLGAPKELVKLIVDGIKTRATVLGLN